ncbi:MAG: hypothetical protein ACOCT9_00780 [archaeon]
MEKEEYVLADYQDFKEITNKNDTFIKAIVENIVISQQTDEKNPEEKRKSAVFMLRYEFETSDALFAFLKNFEYKIPDKGIEDFVILPRWDDKFNFYAQQNNKDSKKSEEQIFKIDEDFINQVKKDIKEFFCEKILICYNQGPRPTD